MRRAVADTRTPQRGASDEWPHRRDLEAGDLRMAHQLKNPLSAMKALVQLGLRNPAHERLAVLEREVDRMSQIPASYLSAAARPEGAELGALASQALLLVSAQAHGVGVRLGARGGGWVEGEPRCLLEAIVNLLSNAIEATPPGGEVVLEVRPEGDRIVILVRDNGSGMPPETLHRVGTPWFTTRGQGTGLGVALGAASGSLMLAVRPTISRTARCRTTRGPLPGRWRRDRSPRRALRRRLGECAPLSPTSWQVPAPAPAVKI